MSGRRFANDVKGDALYMMELVLSLEKLVSPRFASSLAQTPFPLWLVEPCE